MGCISFAVRSVGFFSNAIRLLQMIINILSTFRAQNTLAQNVHSRLEILLFHKSLSLAPKIYFTLSIYLKKYFYVALVRTSSFHKWLSYWYLHNKSTKGSSKSHLIMYCIWNGLSWMHLCLYLVWEYKLWSFSNGEYKIRFLPKNQYIQTGETVAKHLLTLAWLLLPSKCSTVKLGNRELFGCPKIVP